MGALPTEYVRQRVRGRAIACLGGPAHAREAAAGTAALVLGSDDRDLRAQLGEVFDRAGLVCERTGDWIGVETAGAAKNAAALAAAAAEPHGLNAAGIAAAEIWRECVDYALSRGAELDTFTGLAGVGDLTATVLAPGSRNRRAGELLGAGIPAAQIPAQIGQASEALDSVPLIAEAVARRRNRRRRARRARRAGRGRDRTGRVGRPAAAGGERPQRGRVAASGEAEFPRVGSMRADRGQRAEPGREGRARPRLRGPLPRASARRLLVLLLPDRQPPRCRGPDRADLSPGLPALRASAPGVGRPAAASLADQDRPQPRLELSPRPLAPAGVDDRGRRPDLASARHREGGRAGARSCGA